MSTLKSMKIVNQNGIESNGFWLVMRMSFILHLQTSRIVEIIESCNVRLVRASTISVNTDAKTPQEYDNEVDVLAEDHTQEEGEKGNTLDSRVRELKVVLYKPQNEDSIRVALRESMIRSLRRLA